MTRFHTDEYVHFLHRVTPETAEELTYGGTRCESLEHMQSGVVLTQIQFLLARITQLSKVYQNSAQYPLGAPSVRTFSHSPYPPLTHPRRGAKNSSRFLRHRHKLGRGAAPRQETRSFRLLLHQRHRSRHPRAPPHLPPRPLYRHRLPPWGWGRRSVLHDE